MVNINVSMPHAESLQNGTPQLTINHEAIIDLDSSNAFEGPEKLLEVWFAPSATALPGPGLKIVSAEVWKEMLDVVNCKVLSIVESDDVDAYLLSESSMFVFPHKLILKTCGTTTLLWGIPHLLEIAAKYANFAHDVSAKRSGTTSTMATPYRIFYSRKSFLFPDKQLHPHKSWGDEVKYLDQMFAGGSAYMVGKMNGEHWYLYLTNPLAVYTPPATPPEGSIGSIELATQARALNAPVQPEDPWLNIEEENDETLEILMTDLDIDSAKQFYLDHAADVAETEYLRNHSSRSDSTLGDEVFCSTLAEDGEFKLDDYALPKELTTEGHALGTVVSESCGLSDVYPKSQYPDARIDAYQFTPCGFSANAVIPSEGKKSHYFTVHVTPEPHCSYASFETNVPSGQSGRETASVVEHIVQIFRPGRFSVTLFEKTNDLDSSTASLISEQSINNAKKAARMENIAGYRRVDRVRHDLDGYDLVFRHYEREDFKGDLHDWASVSSEFTCECLIVSRSLTVWNYKLQFRGTCLHSLK